MSVYRISSMCYPLNPECCPGLAGFKTTTKREEEPTAMEKRAEEWAKKNAPKKKKEMEPILKGNVKKRRR